MSYSQLTENKRYQIYALKKARYSQHEIAEYIACSTSTISRELKNLSVIVDGEVTGQSKHSSSLKKEEKTAHKARKLTEEVYEKIKILIRQELSHQQVVGYMEKHERTSLRHETIYQLVYADKRSGGDLYQHLRIISKLYRKRYGSSERGVTGLRIA